MSGRELFGRLGRNMGRLPAPLLFLALSFGLDVMLRFDAYSNRIVYLYYRAGIIKTLGAYGLTLTCTLLLLVGLFSWPKIGPWMVGVLAGLTFVPNMAFFATLGHFVNAEDIRILQNADPDAYHGALTSYYRPDMLPFIPYAAILLILALRIGRMAQAPLLRSRGAATALVAGSLVAHFLVWDYLYIKCNDFPLETLTSTLRTTFYVEKENREFFAIARAELEVVDQVEPPKDNIVFVIDESVRTDYVSINRKEADTTPFLAELAKKPGFINYGLMLSATTCSFTSKALIFTGTTVAPDVDRIAMRNPTLFQHAKRYGYRTVVLDGPGRNFPNIVIRPSDLQFVDLLLRGQEISGSSRFADQNAAEWIRKTVNGSSGNFIVLIKVGAHFHYERCYPSSEPRYSRFLPKLALDESYGSSREKTINSYKNALLFTVDAFFETLLLEPLPNTTILWTSDHGQSLQEHGQTYTHCKDEIEQAVVPFALLSDVPWVLQNAAAPIRSDGERWVLSHHNFYPTLISLLAKDREIEHSGYRSIFSSNLEQPPLGYFYGGIWADSRIISPRREDLARFF